MLCRLCLIESTEIFNIFEGDGVRFKIADIISQHFWFVPKKDDHLSNICCTCWLKVDSFHQFYCSIQDAQKNLSEISITERESLTEATRDHIKNENDDNDELKYVTAVSEYAKTTQNNFETDDIIIKSENCDNAELRHDKIEIEDLKDIDNTNQINVTDSKIVSTTYSNGNNLITSCENKTSSPKTKSKTSDKKRPCNASDNEEDLPLTYFRRNRPKRNKNEKSKSEHFVEHNPKRHKKNEKSEYLEKNKENDDIIAKYIALKCEICCEELTTFTQIVQHYRIKHDTKGYVVCFCCGKKLYKKYLLLDHINKYLNPEYFKCNKCDKTFADRKGLKGHISRHYSDNSKTFECDNCSKKFMSKILLSQHKLIHIPPEERQFLCDDCGKAFATNYLLMAHNRHIHQNESGKMCHICAKVIRGKSLFEKHQLEHAGIVESGIQCNKCGARLKNKFSLKRHMYRLHNESLTAHKKCETCEKLFKTQDALRHHIKYVHESERKYQCEICDKTFKVERSLKEHMATHTGEILYTCPHCPKTFNSNANMHSHRKKKHRKEWEETRKDHCVRVLPVPPANGVTITTDIISKNNKNVSNEDIIENNSHQMNESETNVDSI